MFKLFAGSFLIFVSLTAMAQPTNKDLITKTLLVRSEVPDIKIDASQALIKSFDLKRKTYLFPAAILLVTYKKLFSEQIAADCVFERSCSVYAAKAMNERGFLGLFLIADRLTRCDPSAGHNAVPLLFNRQNGKIIDEPDMY